MKKKSVFITTFVISLSSILSLSLIRQYYESAKAYDISTLPTTIDLNDTSSSNIRSYYSSLNSLSISERRGTNLLKNLKPILRNNQKYYSYDESSSTNKIWRIYEISDRDWDKSPASDITYGTYNPSTNKITGYQYGSNKDNPYLHSLYVNRDVENEVRAWGNHEQNQWGINREHVWPKSAGFEIVPSAESEESEEEIGDKTEGGARGDPMHLISGNGFVNKTHSNYYYGYVDTSLSYTDCGKTTANYTNLSGNLLGTSLTMGSGTVFEPQDCDKGDIARAVFYMAARYNHLALDTVEAHLSNEPNLEIVNDTSSYSNKGYMSDENTTGKLGILQDLLEWNRLDPPDEFEIHRNNLLYTNYTNNRNPFIDYPEWAEYIWGTSSNGTYDSSSTGYASPSSDTLNNFSGNVTLSISDETKSLIVGGSDTISATSKDSSSITWTSSDSTVVSLSANSSSSGQNITVSAVGAGSAVITASITIGGELYSKTCNVTVRALTITVDKDFKVGETITKSDITLKDNDNILTDFTFTDYTFTYVDAASGGALTDKTLTLSYLGNNVNFIAKVYRNEYELPKDTLDQSFTGITGTTYTDFTNSSSTSDASYKGQCAGSNSSIQLRSNNNNSGVVQTASGGKVTKVVVEWYNGTSAGRTLNIYGKNATYSAASDLYDTSKQGTLLGSIVKGTSTELTISSDVTFIGFRSNSGALYLSKVEIYYGDNAVSLANYIMFEDTANQCTTKFDVAKGIFETLSSSDRATFMTSNDYVIKSARERLTAWATNQGQSIDYIDNDYKINANKPLTIINDGNVLPITIIGISSLLTILGFVLLRKRKQV